MFLYAGYTDKGCVCEVNEDCLMINGEVRTCFEDAKAETFHAAVFDGVGGEAFGEIAASLAAEKMAELSPPFSWERLHAQLTAANEDIMEKQKLGMRYSRMATTTAGIGFDEGIGFAYNIGDSRVYACHGMTEQISVDQTYLRQTLSTYPDMKPEDIPEEYRHAILNCLGRCGADEHVNICAEMFSPGDYVILTTDGIHDVLSPQEIQSVLDEGQTTLLEKCRSLVRMALAAGSQDNLSVILCKVVE